MGRNSNRAFTPSARLGVRGPGRLAAALVAASALLALAAAPALAAEPPAEPLIQAPSVLAVSATAATLEAELNPRSESGEGATAYLFRYGPCPSLAACSLAPFPSATAAGRLAPDFSFHAVTARLTGLTPATAYHFRLTAENSHGLAPSPGAPGEDRAFTTQSSAPFSLPDGRQWEMVSPPDKGGALVSTLENRWPLRAAADGGALTYFASAATEANPPGFSYSAQVLSSRGPAGWTSRDIAAPNPIPLAGEGTEYPLYSPDLSAAIFQPLGPFDSGLTPAASEQTPYLHSLDSACTGDSCYRPLVTGCPAGPQPCPPAVEAAANVPPGTLFGDQKGDGALGEECGAGINPCGPYLQNATTDLGHVVLASAVPLLPGAGSEQLYEWSRSSGALSIVGLLPNGQPDNHEAGHGPLLGSHQNGFRAISTDGSRVFWTGSNRTNLYMRDTEPGHEATIQLDAKEPACGACQSGGGIFQLASADGSRAFFTDQNRLTADSGAIGKADLYECAILEAAPGEPECQLTDLTPKTGGESADVLGNVLGASADGSYLYFAANGALSSEPGPGGETASPGTCTGTALLNPAFTCNLYLLHEGHVRFLATLSESDRTDWSSVVSRQPVRVSPNGRWLAFMSQRPLTGYDNRDALSGRPDAEVYLYDAAVDGGEGQLLCASCNPAGARPLGGDWVFLNREGAPHLATQATEWQGASVAADLPGGFSDFASVHRGFHSRYQTRNLSDSGRLFFNSFDALLPADSNGTADVYQFEPPGTGSCTSQSPTYSQPSGGCLDLISSGNSAEESAFLEASESGSDVFFLTASKLVPADLDTALDVYDAHLCTGSSPCPPPPPPASPACSGDACQAPATPPGETTPGSLSFQGAGNLLECPKGQVKKSGKCVKQKAKKHHKHKKSHRRAAGHNRGGAQ